MQSTIFAILAGLSFAARPFLYRQSGYGTIGIVIISLVALVLLTLGSLKGISLTEIIADKKGLWLLLLAGISNGLGLLFFGYSLSSGEVSTSSILLNSTVVLSAFVLGVFWVNEPFTVTKLFGVIAIIVGMYLVIVQ